MVDAYYAAYPLEYYEVGKAYSFYAKKARMGMGNNPVVAADDVVKQYSRVLKKLKDDTDQYSFPGEYDQDFIRFYGVVVDKEHGAGENCFDKITVMVQISQDGKMTYGLKKYIVNCPNVWADGQEVLGAMASVEDEGFQYGLSSGIVNKVVPKQKKEHAGITLDEGKAPEHQPITLDENDTNVEVAGKITLDE